MKNPVPKVRGVLVLFLVLLFFSASAHIKIGAQLGLNMSAMVAHNPTFSKANITYDTRPVPGFNVGIVAALPIVKNLYMQPEVLFTTKGGKYVFSNGDQDVITPRFVEIPVNLLFEPYFNASGKSRFILLSGFYYAFRMSGLGKATSHNGNIILDTSFSDMQKTDVGMNLGTGFESGGVEYLFQYQLGFKNIAPSNSYNFKAITSNFSFSIALMF